jgi:hypothetical protein
MKMEKKENRKMADLHPNMLIITIRVSGQTYQLKGSDWQRRLKMAQLATAYKKLI